MMRLSQQQSSCNFRFYNGSGTGNTFLIADITSKKIPVISIKAPLISALHAENRDSGLILEKLKSRVYKMHVIEKDNSESYFCGNGARVIAHYLHKSIGIVLAELETFDEEKALIGKDENGYFVQCGSPISLRTALVDDFRFHNFNVHGEPHYITDDFFDKNKLIEYGERFNNKQPVNISCIIGQEILTYERGVNDITKSCGSACIAATRFRLRNTTLQFDYDLMPWHCPGGTNFVNIKTFTLFGPTFLEEIGKPEKFKRNEILHR